MDYPFFNVLNHYSHSTSVISLHILCVMCLLEWLIFSHIDFVQQIKWIKECSTNHQAVILEGGS